MDGKYDDVTWMHNRGELITLVNTSRRNFVFDLPTGRLRLDAGRSIRTEASLAAKPQIKQLIEDGELSVRSQ